ncbi:MAG: hypothetical protein H7223_13785 [Pedobacter sp.]|nr:hypothetical protein [Pedobacter sp.]
MVDTFNISTLLEAPDKISPNDAPALRNLIVKYPYFQPLRILLAKASLGTEAQKETLAKAALYTNGQVLHTLLHEPKALVKTSFIYGLQVKVEAVEIELEAAQPIELGEAEISEVDEQETFDEIGEVNIDDYREVISEEDKLEQDLVLEHTVATDFFAFQENFQVESIPEIEEQESAEADLLASTAPEDNIVSKYDDDKLPYTFLWWLAKTRKEHQQIFQPYASPKQNKELPEVSQQPSAFVKPSELQQQYVEHIFHLQTPFNAEDLVSGPVNYKVKPGEDEIIENFIKNDPQIRTPRAEQINNDNKARKSAEDHNDMVTETLAKIYIEQMLYDKAIQTYEKLSLKFPEKSRYFADLIQSIQKKI